MLSYEKNIDSTFYYTKKAREIADRLNYEKGKADALNNLGVVYDIKGNLQFALRYYNEANNSYKSLHDSSNIVQTLMNIAMVYNEMGKDQKATHNFKSAMAMGKKLSRDSIMSLVIYNYLLEYPANTAKDSIPIYITKVRNIASKYKDNRSLLGIDQLAADYAIKNNQREKGMALLKQTITKAINSNLYYFSLDMLIEMGDLTAQIEPATAVSYYKQGLDISGKKGYLFYSQILARKLYDLYTARKDSSSAFNYSRQLLQLHDEQDKVNNASGVDYIDYALKEQQLESVRLRSKYQSVFLISTVLICIMTIVIIIILWRNWKNTQRTEKILRLQFEQAEVTKEDLDIMNKNYARLIKIVAHDLRTPMGAISTISSILSKNDLGDEANDWVKLMQTSADNGLNLISELLKTDFEQQETLNKEETSIDELLQQCVQLLSFQAKDKKQQLILDSSKNIKVLLDKGKTARVINNLIVNAIKFSPENSDIHITARQVGNNVIIKVKDVGIGIPANMQDKIFDPFTTAKRRGTGNEQPFGLGLYISKQIIEAHSGKIGFKSEAGEGTEFFIELAL